MPAFPTFHLSGYISTKPPRSLRWISKTTKSNFCQHKSRLGTMDRNPCWQVVWLDNIMARKTCVLFARVENDTNMRRHGMETLSTLLTLYEGNPPIDSLKLSYADIWWIFVVLKCMNVVCDYDKSYMCIIWEATKIICDRYIAPV